MAERRAAVGGYTEHDAQRWLPERHTSARSDFARDRARLLHSSALRRLGAKTQVLSPTAGLDFARTRLTHSLEVAQVGRELGASLGLNPDIVDTACLAHDLGHPPFGHNGERALDEWARGIGGFEGNAQTLRILTRLEPKTFDAAGRSYGLNLTRASLDASCKYPWSLRDAVIDVSGRAKFGFYEDDAAAFTWLREGAPGVRKCMGAQVMDLADDIAYSVHDFEDAVFGGFVDLALLSDPAARSGLVAEMAEFTGDEYSHDELLSALLRLQQLEDWLPHWSGTRSDQASLKNLTSQLIGRFAAAATEATRAAFPAQDLTRYRADVITPPEIAAEIAVLKGITAVLVVSHNSRLQVYVHQREVLTELADALYLGDGRHLDSSFTSDWWAAQNDAARKRVIVDQIASLTDQSAFAWHVRLTGLGKNPSVAPENPGRFRITE